MPLQMEPMELPNRTDRRPQPLISSSVTCKKLQILTANLCRVSHGEEQEEGRVLHMVAEQEADLKFRASRLSNVFHLEVQPQKDSNVTRL